MLLELKVTKLIINDKEFNFKNEDTLIYSNKNSVGKTTLIRLLLYALGYNVPSTKGTRFKNLELSITLKKEDKEIKIERKGENLVTSLDPDNILYADISEDMSALHSMIYNIDMPDILNNILGLFYFDQEKGWTLLNRGLIIGSLHFSIEELIEGLDKKNLIELESKLNKLEQERKIYNQFNKLVELQNEYQGKGYTSDKSTLELQNEYRTLKLELDHINKDIKGYVKIQKDNTEFIKLIERSGIRISVNGEEIPVTQKNIIGYTTNQQLLNALLARKRNFKKEYEKSLYKVEEQLNDKLKLVNVEDQLAKFSNFLSDNNFNSQNISLLISQRSQEIGKLKQTIRNELYHSKITLEIYKRIKKYSKILGIEDSIDDKEDFIFTSDLKRYSGAKLHLLVFAFRMALLKEVQEKSNIKLPIILDSPKTGELDTYNLALMFKLLNEEFKDNQLIVASMTKPTEFSKIHKWNNLIELKNRVLE